MNNFIPALLTAEAATVSLSFAERISLGLQVLFFGMGVVFAVLILLWFILVLFRIVFYDIPSKKQKEAEAPVEEAVETPAAQVEPAVETAVAESTVDETELVAAITAAIAMTLDKPQTSFRVVSFRRTASK